jgi:hypothetical protein
MKHRVQRINVAQLAKLMGVLDLMLGVVVGVCFYLFSTVAGSAASSMFPMMGGIGMLIFFPVMYGVFGFVGGALIAWLYNLVAGMVGGVEFEIEAVP